MGEIERLKKKLREMQEREKQLLTMSQISKKLLSVQTNESFEALLQECLSILGKSIGKNRVYLWKDYIDEEDNACSMQIYEWVRGTDSVQANPQFNQICYVDFLTFKEIMSQDRCMNTLLHNLTIEEQAFLEAQNIKSLLITPIAIGAKRWGFIGVDNCEKEQVFTDAEENLLIMSGSMMANAIEKVEAEDTFREMEERTQIILNAMPLCCNLWTSGYLNMSCNEEAVRLFEVSSQKEYLDRFHELSPEYQPNGRRSSELAREWVSRAFQEGYCRFEWMHQKLDGTHIPAEITLVRIKYKEDFIVAGYTRDLREQKAMLAELQMKETLRMARDEALLNSKAKSNFLANMSHEIRTPMNAISGLSEIILRESTDAQMAEYALGIKNASSNLIHIINEILDISKIEMGKLEIMHMEYKLSALLHDVITIARMRLGSKPLMFLTYIDSRLPAVLIGDALRIKQILLNLLSNAIKFTQDGYIALRVEGNVVGKRVNLRCSVVDSGVGIRDTDLSGLFVEFERINTTKNRTIEGTGLGLPIAKELCEMMEGYITVESTYGKGSTFSAMIPQAYVDDTRVASLKENKRVLVYEPRKRYRLSIMETLENLECQCISCVNQSELYSNITAMQYDYIFTEAMHLKKVQQILEKNELQIEIAVFTEYGDSIVDTTVNSLLFPVNCLQLAVMLNGESEELEKLFQNEDLVSFTAPSARVLIADDNVVNLQVARGLLAPYQLNIETARNGLEAVEMIMHTEYDLVFMDHMMPGMDGVDATVTIRRQQGAYYQNLPIVALTANAIVGTREMFIQEGMNDFLAKPVEVYKLAQMLLKWLPYSKIIKEPVQNRKKASEGTMNSLVDIGINTVCGIASVGGSVENYMQILETYFMDGNQKLVSLRKHKAQENFYAIQIEVHAIKSTSAVIGAFEISESAARHEEAAKNKDMLLIQDHLDEFLNSFQVLLEGIGEMLQSQLPKKEALLILEDKPRGELHKLKQELEALYEAAEFANIGKIETIIAELQGYLWSEEIRRELQNMENQISIFDYDAIMECVLRLGRMGA